jgi:hypothetical protein
VFEGAAPSPVAVVHLIRREAQLWKVAGLFRAELAQVDRWRLGDWRVVRVCVFLFAALAAWIA